jgi:hypothetical protein
MNEASRHLVADFQAAFVAAFAHIDDHTRHLMPEPDADRHVHVAVEHQRVGPANGRICNFNQNVVVFFDLRHREIDAVERPPLLCGQIAFFR